MGDILVSYKLCARRLASYLHRTAPGAPEMSHSHMLHAIAAGMGFPSWQAFSSTAAVPCPFTEADGSALPHAAIDRLLTHLRARHRVEIADPMDMLEFLRKDEHGFRPDAVDWRPSPLGSAGHVYHPLRFLDVREDPAWLAAHDHYRHLHEEKAGDPAVKLVFISDMLKSDLGALDLGKGKARLSKAAAHRILTEEFWAETAFTDFIKGGRRIIDVSRCLPEVERISSARYESMPDRVGPLYIHFGIHARLASPFAHQFIEGVYVELAKHSEDNQDVHSGTRLTFALSWPSNLSFPGTQPLLARLQRDQTCDVWWDAESGYGGVFEFDTIADTAESAESDYGAWYPFLEDAISLAAKAIVFSALPANRSSTAFFPTPQPEVIEHLRSADPKSRAAAEAEMRSRDYASAQVFVPGNSKYEGGFDMRNLRSVQGDDLVHLINVLGSDPAPQYKPGSLGYSALISAVHAPIAEKQWNVLVDPGQFVGRDVMCEDAHNDLLSQLIAAGRLSLTQARSIRNSLLGKPDLEGLTLVHGTRGLERDALEESIRLGAQYPGIWDCLARLEIEMVKQGKVERHADGWNLPFNAVAPVLKAIGYDALVPSDKKNAFVSTCLRIALFAKWRRGRIVARVRDGQGQASVLSRAAWAGIPQERLISQRHGPLAMALEVPGAAIPAGMIGIQSNATFTDGEICFLPWDEGFSRSVVPLSLDGDTKGALLRLQAMGPDVPGWQDIVEFIAIALGALAAACEHAETGGTSPMSSMLLITPEIAR